MSARPWVSRHPFAAEPVMSAAKCVAGFLELAEEQGPSWELEI